MQWCGERQTSQEIFAARQRLPDLTRGKGRVKEVADLRQLQNSPQERRQQHQMKAMYPNKIALVIHLCHLVPEESIHVVVGSPEVLLALRADIC